MSLENYETKKAIFDAMDAKMAISPNMPVGTALQEAEDLYKWCQSDKESLTKVGLDWRLVTDLPVRTGACRYIQSEWKKDYRSQEEAQKEWKEKAPAAFDFRNELVHDFLFAYANTPDLYAKTQKIAEGGSNADMIQDLSDISVLGKAYAAPLLAIGFDMSKLDKATALVAELAPLLAQANGNAKEDNKMRIERDKAFAHLKEAVDEIRRCGQYLFWKDESRRKGYVSEYLKAKSQNKTSQTTTTSTSAKA
jgi:hypothetical protein